MSKLQEDLRGIGTVFRRRHKNRKGKWVESDIYWIMFYNRGRKIRKSAKTDNRSKAIQFLKDQIEVELGGRMTTGVAGKMKFDQLCQSVIRDYTRNKRRSLDRAEDAINHMKLFFGTARALEIDKPLIDSYVDYRQDVDHAANGTVRYELSILKRAFRLCRSILGPGPEFPIVRVFNTRKGFFEEVDFQKLLAAVDDDVKPALEFAYLTGWRIASEILPLQWSNVDFLSGAVRLDVGTTKNDEGRIFPFAVLPELEALMRRQREHTERVQREEGIIIPWVFHRGGKRIKSMKGAWHRAVEKAEIGKHIPHDFRRTAVRALEQGGVPRSVAMQLVGHKTESIYRRYAIVAARDLVDGVRRLADYRTRVREEAAKVVSIARGQ